MAMQFHSRKHTRVIIHTPPSPTHRSLLIACNRRSVSSKQWYPLSHLPMLSPPIATTLRSSLSIRIKLHGSRVHRVRLISVFFVTGLFHSVECLQDFIHVVACDWISFLFEVVSHRVSVSYFGSLSTFSFFYSFETESYSVTSSEWPQTH